jgi:hypothetical protein
MPNYLDDSLFVKNFDFKKLVRPNNDSIMIKGIEIRSKTDSLLGLYRLQIEIICRKINLRESEAFQ